MALAEICLGSFRGNAGHFSGETLKAVLDKDSAKELHFQKSPAVEVEEEQTVPHSKASAKNNTEGTGICFL